MNSRFKIVYHRQCLDGVSSAALLSYFLEKLGVKNITFKGLTYPLDKIWWRQLKIKNKNLAILDFVYHPKANIWVDHHEDPFIFKDWKLNFKPRFFVFYKKEAPSTTGLLFNFLKENFRFNLDEDWINYIKIVDECDSARFKNLSKLFYTRNLGYRLYFLLEEFKFLEKQLLRKLFRTDVYIINKEIEPFYKKFLIKLKEAFRYFRSNLKTEGSIVIFDNMPKKFSSFKQILPFLLHPDKKYLWVSWKEKNFYYFRFYYNSINFNLDKEKINLGLLVKNLVEKNPQGVSGGGHKGVGAGELKSKEALEKIKKELFKKVI
jgi:hypothetical protein